MPKIDTRGMRFNRSIGSEEGIIEEDNSEDWLSISNDVANTQSKGSIHRDGSQEIVRMHTPMKDAETLSKEGSEEQNQDQRELEETMLELK